MQILEAIDSPWLKVQYDPSNAVVAGDDPYELLERVADRVATMHASDRYLQGGSVEDLVKLDADPQHGYAPFLRHGVIGEGFNDFDRIFARLARAGFAGWVSIEDGDAPTIEQGMENLRLSAGFCRRKLAEHFPRKEPSGMKALKNPLEGGPKVQISLDLESLDDALKTAEIAVRAGVDWLEAGTPLILAEGLHAVRALRKRFPKHPIVADLKTMDAGYLEAEMMFRAGATFVVVMGLAHEQTIKEAVRAAREYGGYVMGDIMLHPDKRAIARRMEELGVDVIIVHTGYDERHAEVGKNPLDDLA